MKKLYSILLMLPLLTHASLPTVEGLFRNAHNAEIKGNTAAVSFSLVPKEKATENVIQGLIPMPVAEEDEDRLDNKGFYKLIFSLEENKPIPMLQVRYKGEGMSLSEVNDVFVISDLMRQIRGEKVLEKQFFYSLISMLVLNKSEGFDSLFKKIAPKYKSNKELINPRKKRLYERYKQYLSAIKEDPELKEELESPMRPEDEEQREEIKELRKESFYLDNGDVALTREKGKFYWQIDLGPVRGLFTQEEHRLSRLSVDTIQGAIEITVSDYVLMDGTHELPQKVVISHPEFGLYHLRFLNVQDFTSQNTTFADRVQEYRERLNANQAQATAQENPELLKPLPFTY